jgi:3-methyladenine DNA glycosylase/8-oxoguanine DNA glycosylase
LSERHYIGRRFRATSLRPIGSTTAATPSSTSLQQRLPARRQPFRRVRERVAGQQRRLEQQHRGVPDLRRKAEQQNTSFPTIGSSRKCSATLTSSASE